MESAVNYTRMESVYRIDYCDENMKEGDFTVFCPSRQHRTMSDGKKHCAPGTWTTKLKFCSTFSLFVKTGKTEIPYYIFLHTDHSRPGAEKSILC